MKTQPLVPAYHEGVGLSCGGQHEMDGLEHSNIQKWVDGLLVDTDTDLNADRKHYSGDRSIMRDES